MTKRMSKNSKKNIGIAAVLIVLVAALLFYNSNHPLAIGGVTLGSLSHVLVQTVYKNYTYSGYYWFATLYANGGAQMLSSFSYSSDQLAQTAGPNYTGNPSQTDNFMVNVLKNQLIWRANGGLGSYILHTYSLEPFTGSFTFTNCNGQSEQVFGNQPAANSYSCLINEAQALASYSAACENAATNSNNIGIPIIGGTAIGGGLECVVIHEAPYANVYYLGNSYGDAATFNQSVQVTLNGQMLQVSTANQFAAHTNSSGKVDFTVQLLPTANGGSSSIPSAPAALFVNNTGTQAITLASANHLQIVSQKLNQQISAYVLNQSKDLYYPWEINNTLSGWNSEYVGSLVEQPLGYNYQLNGSAIILNDNNFQVITPVIQITSGLPLLGIVQSQANCQIISASPATFVSESLGTSYVKVQNNGNPGDCKVTAQVASPFFVQQGYLTTGILNTSQSTTLTFDIGSSQSLSNSNYAESTKITYTVCDMITGTICQTVNTTATESSVCSNGYTQVNGVCQPLTTISIPTTSVCTGSCSPTSTSTTLPECQPPAVFNESMYLKNNTDACWIAPNQQVGTGWYILGGIILVAVVYYIATLRTKVNSGRVRR